MSKNFVVAIYQATSLIILISSIDQKARQSLLIFLYSSTVSFLL